MEEASTEVCSFWLLREGRKLNEVSNVSPVGTALYERGRSFKTGEMCPGWEVF